MTPTSDYRIVVASFKFFVLVILFILFMLLAQCLIGSLVGAVVLRVACSTFNTFYGGKNEEVATPQPTMATVVDTTPVKPASLDSPYTSPTTPLASAYPERPPCLYGVPIPEFGNAFVICLCASVVRNFFALIGSAAIVFLLGDPNSPLIWNIFLVVLILVGVLALATMTSANLPTAFVRGLGVAGLYSLIMFAIVAAVSTIVVTVMALVR